MKDSKSDRLIQNNADIFKRSNSNVRLLKEGFNANEILSMSKVESGPIEKLFRKTDQKEIPALKIEIPWSEPDFSKWIEESLERMSNGSYRKR